METFYALLAICAGNSPVTGEFPAQRPVTWSFDVFFDLRLNKRLSKQRWGWWFEMPWCPLWHHCNDCYTLNSSSTSVISFWWCGWSTSLMCGGPISGFMFLKDSCCVSLIWWTGILYGGSWFTAYLSSLLDTCWGIAMGLLQILYEVDFCYEMWFVFKILYFTYFILNTLICSFKRLPDVDIVIALYKILIHFFIVFVNPFPNS